MTAEAGRSSRRRPDDPLRLRDLVGGTRPQETNGALAPDSVHHASLPAPFHDGVDEGPERGTREVIEQDDQPLERGEREAALTAKPVDPQRFREAMVVHD